MNMKLRNIPFSPPEQYWFMVNGERFFDERSDKVDDMVNGKFTVNS